MDTSGNIARLQYSSLLFHKRLVNITRSIYHLQTAVLLAVWVRAAGVTAWVIQLNCLQSPLTDKQKTKSHTWRHTQASPLPSSTSHAADIVRLNLDHKTSIPIHKQVSIEPNLPANGSAAGSVGPGLQLSLRGSYSSTAFRPRHDRS
jgi:hypothetical protein